MRAWLKEKGRVAGAIGAGLGSTLVDFHSTLLSDAVDAAFVIGLFVLIWPLLRSKADPE